MKVHALFMVALALLVATARNDAGDKKAKTDKEKLQGAWKLVGGEADGKPTPEEKVKDIDATLSFDGDKVTFKPAKGEADESAYTIDPTKKPKAVDIERKKLNKTAKGIYELKGDELRVCIDIQAGEDRPTAFATKEGGKTSIYVFKRIK